MSWNLIGTVEMLFRGYCVWGSIDTSNWEAISFQNGFPDPSVARSYQMLISSGGSERPTTNAARSATTEGRRGLIQSRKGHRTANTHHSAVNGRLKRTLM